MDYVTIVQNRTRAGTEGVTLRLPKFKTEYYAHSFFVCIVPVWNQLPTEVQCMTDLKAFNERLQLFYKAKLLFDFDSENTCSWVSKCRCANCRPCF